MKPTFDFGKQVTEVIAHLLDQAAHTATKYLSERLIVRATQPMFGPKGKRRVLKSGNLLVVVTVGKPNFSEREFIKKCKKAGEPFPVKKIQFKFPKK